GRPVLPPERGHHDGMRQPDRVVIRLIGHRESRGRGVRGEPLRDVIRGHPPRGDHRRHQRTTRGPKHYGGIPFKSSMMVSSSGPAGAAVVRAPMSVPTAPPAPPGPPAAAVVRPPVAVAVPELAPAIRLPGAPTRPVVVAVARIVPPRNPGSVSPVASPSISVSTRRSPPAPPPRTAPTTA